jgi:hypothetical protein
MCTVLKFCSCENNGYFIGHISVPPFGQNAQDAQCASSTEPSFCNLFQVLDAVYHIPLGEFVGQIQQVNGASLVDNVDSHIADLTQPM